MRSMGGLNDPSFLHADSEESNQTGGMPRLIFVCLFMLAFYDPVNNEVMSSQSVNRGIVPGQA